MERMKGFKLWELSHELVMLVYKYTEEFPKLEQFGLTSQLRRAVVSVPSNIAEGKARESNKEYLRFLYISRGSLEEVRYQLYLSKELGYLNPDRFLDLEMLIDRIGQLTNGLVRKLK